MKKILLIFLFIFLWSALAQGQVNVFFLPDSGYIRVEAEVTINPKIPSLSLMLFPNAQITEFWADELEKYQIERGPQSTIVSFSVKHLQSQKLNFSYEGFLSPQGELVAMDRDSLWFPEFSFAIDNPKLVLQIPSEWSWLVGQEYTYFEQGASQIIQWQGRSQNYPVFFLARDTSFLPSDYSVFGNEQPVPEAVFQIEEYLSKLQMQVSRLTSSMNRRNIDELAILMNDSLQQEGLAQYLASIPLHYGRITSEFLTQPRHLTDSFHVLFSTEKGPRFKGSMVWDEPQGRVELQTFSLTPYGFTASGELFQALEDFVKRLEEAVQMEDRATLHSLVDADPQSEVIVDFFASLSAQSPWPIHYIALEPFAITILVPHAENTKLLLNVGLRPTEEGFLINSLDVVPLG